MSKRRNSAEANKSEKRSFEDNDATSAPSTSPTKTRGNKHVRSNFTYIEQSRSRNPASSRVVYEQDRVTLNRRQKQIDYGKNTLGYEKYRQLIPKDERTVEHPRTPRKEFKMSRRKWDSLIKNWRLKLHEWDPKSETSENC